MPRAPGALRKIMPFVVWESFVILLIPMVGRIVPYHPKDLLMEEKVLIVPYPKA
jgi:hypothetical protein